MHIAQGKQFIRQVIEKGVHVPILMVGSMGVGKSEIVSQIAKELNIGIVDLRLATQEPGDLIGLPRTAGLAGAMLDFISAIATHVQKEATTHAILRLLAGAVLSATKGVATSLRLETVYAVPEWFPKPGTKGILFLDELNRAPVDVRQGVFQVLTEGRLHTHVLPEGWFIVSAINPDNQMYQVEALDQAMIRRFCCIVVSANPEGWLSWAHRKKAEGGGEINEAVTSFIAANPALLQMQEDIHLDIKYTTAGWTMLNRLVDAKAIPQEIEIDVFTGLVGNNAAILFRKWLDAKYERPASGDDVLNNYAKVQAKVKKQKSDENYTTITEMVAIMENNKKPTKAQATNLVAFLNDVTNEFKTTLIKKLPKEWFAQVVDCETLTDGVIDAMNKARNG